MILSAWVVSRALCDDRAKSVADVIEFARIDQSGTRDQLKNA